MLGSGRARLLHPSHNVGRTLLRVSDGVEDFHDPSSAGDQRHPFVEGPSAGREGGHTRGVREASGRVRDESVSDSRPSCKLTLLRNRLYAEPGKRRAKFAEPSMPIAEGARLRRAPPRTWDQIPPGDWGIRETSAVRIEEQHEQVGGQLGEIDSAGGRVERQRREFGAHQVVARPVVLEVWPRPVRPAGSGLTHVINRNPPRRSKGPEPSSSLARRPIGYSHRSSRRRNRGDGCPT
jgi:hypothetical protein